MKFKLAVIMLIISSLLCSCRVIKEINQKISPEIVTAKEIAKITDEIVKAEWGKKDFYLLQVWMDLNENHRGTIYLKYADGIETKDTVPNMIRITVDTNKHIILSLTKLQRHSKLYPGLIEFDKWKIDSIDAYKITRDLFEDTNIYNSVIISSVSANGGDEEAWRVTLWQGNTRYGSFINPYTGEIISYNTEVVEH